VAPVNQFSVALACAWGLLDHSVPRLLAEAAWLATKGAEVLEPPSMSMPLMLTHCFPAALTWLPSGQSCPLSGLDINQKQFLSIPKMRDIRMTFVVHSRLYHA
jgi:hypothetical protein